MVDLRPTNAKLKDRARRIIMAAADVGPDRAEALLSEAGDEAKTAIVMARLGLSAPEARQALAGAGGQVRRVLHGR
jgi:N-acetylmuramic acid 6-phosphate etherase